MIDTLNFELMTELVKGLYLPRLEL